MKKILRSIGRSKVARIALVVLAIAALFGGGFMTGQAVTPVVVSGSVMVPEAKVAFLTPLSEMYLLLERYFYGELPSQEELLEGAAEGMIEALPPNLGDYTYFHDPTKAEMVAAELEGKFAGIGVRLTSENGQLIISSLEPDGPAEKGGLKAGDTIVAVDGQSVVGVDWDTRHRLFRGEPGTKVTVSVYRIGEGDLEFVLTRAIIETPAVRTRILADGKIGYISLGEFTSAAPNEMREALKQLLRSDKVKALILDLRGNPGGYQTSAIQITSQFLGGGEVVMLLYSEEGESQLYTQKGGLATEIPLVVLIDEGSASSSEVLAGALQDHGRATLIGVTTHGKGVGQRTHGLSDGSAIAIVDHEFRTPNGNRVHGVGIRPDVFVPTNPAQRVRGQDPALDRGIEELLKQLGK